MLAANGIETHAVPTAPGTNGNAGRPPSPAPSGGTILQYVVGAYPPDLALRLLTFASTLPEDQARIFLELLRATDDATAAWVAAGEQVRWQQLLAHLPGLAPALDIVRAHIQRTEPPCTPDGHCTLGR